MNPLPLSFYLQEGEVLILLNEDDLKIAHDDFTVVVHFVECLVALVGIARHTEPVESACTDWNER